MEYFPTPFPPNFFFLAIHKTVAFKKWLKSLREIDAMWVQSFNANNIFHILLVS